MRLTYVDKLFQIHDDVYTHGCDLNKASKLSNEGFLYSDELEAWTTPSIEVAARLREYADDRAKKKIHSQIITHTPWPGRIQWPRGLTPKPFQLTAARFALERNRSYIAADPGMGKTIIAALVLNALKRPVVFICPPSLALNTKYELEKWCTWKPRICIYGLDTEHPAVDITIIPDSALVDPLGEREELWAWVKYNAKLKATLIVDEANRFNQMSAQRTIALMGDYGLAHHFKHIVFMSGTPLDNRAMELFPILSRFAPETIKFRGEEDYGQRYCKAYFNGFGWSYPGSDNMDELAKNVHGKFMLRIRKSEHLKEIPPKTKELVFLGENLPARISAMDKSLLAKYSPEDLYTDLAPNGHVATYRRMLGLAKAPYAIEYIKDTLDWCDEAMLVFAMHTEVVEKLAKGLKKYKPILLTAKVKTNERQRLVQEFQKNKKHRIFLCNTKLGGIGFTLTRATLVSHVEASWVPGVNTQATDRAHRIGQLRNVFERYLVFRNSMDRRVIESNLRKSNDISLI